MLPVSIVIPTYNKVSRLNLTLLSFNRQTYPLDNFEIVVIDDGSTDGTSDLLGSLQPPYQLKTFHQSNQGRSSARNRGIELASHDLIIFIDDDCLASPGFIDGHVRAHTRSENLVVHGTIYTLSYLRFFSDPASGIIYPDLPAPKVAADVSRLQDYRITPEDVLNEFSRISKLHPHLTRMELAIHQVLSDPSLAKTCSWLGATGGNLSAKRKHLQAVGQFDEKMGRGWGAEDLELGYRLFKSGCQFAWEPEAANYHMAHYRMDFLEQGEKAFDYFIHKHQGSEEIRLLWSEFFAKEMRDISIYCKAVQSIQSETKHLI